MAGVSADPKHRTTGTIYFRQRGIIAIIVITDTLQPLRWMHFDFYNVFLDPSVACSHSHVLQSSLRWPNCICNRYLWEYLCNSTSETDEKNINNDNNKMLMEHQIWNAFCHVLLLLCKAIIRKMQAKPKHTKVHPYKKRLNRPKLRQKRSEKIREFSNLWRIANVFFIFLMAQKLKVVKGIIRWEVLKAKENTFT